MPARRRAQRTPPRHRRPRGVVLGELTEQHQSAQAEQMELTALVAAVEGAPENPATLLGLLFSLEVAIEEIKGALVSLPEEGTERILREVWTEARPDLGAKALRAALAVTTYVSMRLQGGGDADG